MLIQKEKKEKQSRSRRSFPTQPNSIHDDPLYNKI